MTNCGKIVGNCINLSRHTVYLDMVEDESPFVENSWNTENSLVILQDSSGFGSKRSQVQILSRRPIFSYLNQSVIYDNGCSWGGALICIYILSCADICKVGRGKFVEFLPIDLFSCLSTNYLKSLHENFNFASTGGPQ